VQGGAPPFLFSMDKTGWHPATDFTQLAAGEYTIYSQDGNDCEQTESIVVPEIPPITIVALDQTLACRDSVLLKPVVVSQLPFTWQWQNGSTDSVLWVNLPGVYAFTIENACEKPAGSIEVALEDDGPVSMIYMPNSFSPNDDGFNDCYRGYINPDVELLEYTLKIFDRWGNHLFETHDIEGCWDGLFREKPMDPAVVVYFITMQVRNCEGEVEDVFREGGIHIMR
jgi:gliding motility-associated-like protein